MFPRNIKIGMHYSLLSLFFLLFNFIYPSDQKIVYEKKLVIVIPSFNNKNWYKKNLDSIFSQNYHNYRVIYIDDCSPDGTGDLVEQYIKDKRQEDKVTLIKNSTRNLALANLYKAIHMCDDDEIVLTYDGDDWFADDNVLSLINNVYSDPNVWITHSSFKSWPGDEPGYSAEVPKDIVDKRIFRETWWAPGQLRAFYAWLFKQIKLQDLIFNNTGLFFPATYDLAIFWPMMEMAGNHYKFIPEVIYIRNIATPLNDFKINKKVQMDGARQLIKQQKYERLQQPYSDHFDRFNRNKADALIFSSSPAQLEQLLDSIENNSHGINDIYVISNINNEKERRDYYNRVQKKFNLVHFFECDSENNINALVRKFFDLSENEHVLLATDDFIIEDFVDIHQCIISLEKTFSYTFSLFLNTSLNTKAVPLNKLNDNVCAWNFKYGKDMWAKPNNCLMTLYRKKDIKNQLQDVEFDLNKWVDINIDDKKMGLCFEKPKVIPSFKNHGPIQVIGKIV